MRFGKLKKRAVYNSIIRLFGQQCSRIADHGNEPSAVPVTGQTSRALETTGGLAQLVERLLCKQNVIGSNPVTSTIPAGL